MWIRYFICGWFWIFRARTSQKYVFFEGDLLHMVSLSNLDVGLDWVHISPQNMISWVWSGKFVFSRAIGTRIFLNCSILLQKGCTKGVWNMKMIEASEGGFSCQNACTHHVQEMYTIVNRGLSPIRGSGYLVTVMFGRLPIENYWMKHCDISCFLC